LKSRFTTRDIALISLLSALWAALEISLGSALRMFKIPFSGSILTFLGLFIIFAGRCSLSRRGSVLIMGVATAFLKLIYLGGLALFPVIGILIESVLVELILKKQPPTRAEFLIAGSAGLLWSLFHPFFAQGALAGWGLLRVYVLVIERGSHVLGIGSQYAWILFAVLIVIHIALGLLAGSLGWKFSHILLHRSHVTHVHKIA